MAQDEQEHPLNEYLTTHLPPLGLDAETYSPYVTGYFEARQDDGTTLSQMETDEDFEQLMELLQASSETHAEDETVWIDLSQSLIDLHRDYLVTLESKRQDALEEQRMAQTQKKMEELELAKRNQAEMEKKREQLKEEANKGGVMDASKRALLEQYGYEDQQYDDDGNVIAQEEQRGGAKGKKKGETAASSSEVTSNKAYAQQMNRERAQDSRSNQRTTKTEERQKTKNAKLDKMKKKEERRNRAHKGERKR